MSQNSVYIQSLASIYPKEAAVNGRFTASEPDYKEWISDAGQRRRMSRIVKMGVTAGLQCMGSAKPDCIITATGLGCLADTEKFLHSIDSQNEELLSPSPFIQSTFNTIGGQIALLSGNNAPNMTYVHRAFSFESALLDATLQLSSGDARSVLVGAVDELTSSSFEILQRMGAWRKFPAGEGAAFFLLSGEREEKTVARVIGIDMWSGDFGTLQLKQRWDKMLSRFGADDAFIISPEYYKSVCGEYMTASSFGLWYACTRSADSGFILITNSFLGNHSAVLIERL